MVQKIITFFFIYTLCFIPSHDMPFSQLNRRQKDQNLFDQENYRDAVDTLELAIIDDPDDHRAHFYLARAYFRMASVSLNSRQLELRRNQLLNALSTIEEAIRIESEPSEYLDMKNEILDSLKALGAEIPAISKDTISEIPESIKSKKKPPVPPLKTTPSSPVEKPPKTAPPGDSLRSEGDTSEIRIDTLVVINANQAYDENNRNNSKEIGHTNKNNSVIFVIFIIAIIIFIIAIVCIIIYALRVKQKKQFLFNNILKEIKSEKIKLFILKVICLFLFFNAIVACILFFHPKKISTKFEISSRYVSFIISTKNEMSYLFNRVIKIRRIRLYNIHKLELHASEIKFENSKDKDNVPLYGKLIIKPSFRTTTNIEIVTDDDKDIILNKIPLPRVTKLSFSQQPKNSLIISYAEKNNENGIKVRDREYLHIKKNFKLILKDCKYFNGKSDSVDITDKNGKTGIIKIINKPSRLYFKKSKDATDLELDISEQAWNKPITLIENIAGDSFTTLSDTKFKKSSIKKGSNVIIKLNPLKPDSIKLKAEDDFIMKPVEFFDFKLSVDKSGLLATFSTDISELRIGHADEIEKKPNRIPNYLEWLIDYKPTFTILISILNAILGLEIAILGLIFSIKRSKDTR